MRPAIGGRAHTKFASLFILASAASLATAQTFAACDNTPAYTPCELVFQLDPQTASANPNPYKTVELRAELRSPRHRTIELPAFWDGARMVVRFAPTEGGQWDYHLVSTIASLNDKTGSFTATDSESYGFIAAANVHHWAYTEHPHTEIQKAHLWMGASAPRFALMGDGEFRAMADLRAAQKFNHLSGWITGDDSAAYSAPDQPRLDYFHNLDVRVRYLNEKGIVADLVLAGGADAFAQLFPDAAARRRFVRYAVARYAAMNVTWQAVDAFEDYPDARALLKEIGGALKEFDGYHHPRTAGAHITSSPLLDDGWMDFVSQGKAGDDLGAIEHQLYAVPFVNQNIGGADAATLRHSLWNAYMDGQYPALTDAGEGAPEAVKAFSVWFDIVSSTRHWELEPYFDVDGGRALALEDTEYLVYLEHPSALELRVEKHGYDALWIDPADGTTVRKKFSGDHFTGAPPDTAHDWVLHLVREGTLQSMNRSYKFESRDIAMQEVEANPEKAPFDIDQPAGDVTLEKSTPFAIKMKRETRATRTMMYLWTGEVTADHQGYRVLGTGARGSFQPPRRLAVNYPALLLLRVYGMNANGKVYLATKAVQLNQ